MALHHGIFHVLGGTGNVPHGIATSIMLPHVMRNNLDTTALQLAECRAEVVAEEGIQRVSDLIRRLGLPQRLRDVGVPKDDLPRLAQLALKSRAVQNNPRQIRDASQIMELLQAAW